MHHLDGKTAETAEVPIGVEFIPQTGAADLENISTFDQTGLIEGLAEGTTEGGAFVKTDIASIDPPDLHLDGHGDPVGEDMDSHDIQLTGGSQPSGQVFELGNGWMGQGDETGRALQGGGTCRQRLLSSKTLTPHSRSRSTLGRRKVPGPAGTSRL